VIYTYDINNNDRIDYFLNFTNPIYINPDLYYSKAFASNYPASQTIIYVPWNNPPQNNVSVIIEHQIYNKVTVLGKPLVNISISGTYLDNNTGHLYALGQHVIESKPYHKYHTFLWLINRHTLTIQDQVFNLTKYGVSYFGLPSTFDQESRVIYYLTSFNYSQWNIVVNVVQVNLQSQQVQIIFTLRDIPAGIIFYIKNLIVTYMNSTTEVLDLTGKVQKRFQIVPIPIWYGVSMTATNAFLYDGDETTGKQLLVPLVYYYPEFNVYNGSAYAVSLDKNYEIVSLGNYTDATPADFPDLIIPWKP